MALDHVCPGNGAELLLIFVLSLKTGNAVDPHPHFQENIFTVEKSQRASESSKLAQVWLVGHELLKWVMGEIGSKLLKLDVSLLQFLDFWTSWCVDWHDPLECRACVQWGPGLESLEALEIL